ncbi:hypothetical protein GCM10010275_30210 [Streptomyces litmocidini]|nr:hypothetical protein [Streptomyces litmocidini]GGU91104.1 hypothetical protein GCM10010275_30210 [Streptomyces litmocidini]
MGLFDRFKSSQPADPEPDCPPDCVKCAESASIDPDYIPQTEDS